ncbi:MAG TPA: hypothetical protein DCW90_10685 [Lachnospiraceae bacterium]|nr:hypothetical protein [Lachnospiraceae bacterium]
MDFYDLIYNNIFTLSKGDMLDIPDNKEEIQKEIISIIKKNNLSLTQSAMIFNSIIKKLGNTPINEL